MAATQIKLAQAPFNIPSADAVLRTSDNVDFYVHKVILSIASPFFNDLFSLIQPSINSDAKVIEEPIIISEDSQTLDSLLRLCYPVDDPVITDISLLGCVLEAAIKYQMGEAEKLVKVSMQPFVVTHPLQIYAIACRLKVEELAKVAAQSWKSQRGSVLNTANFSSTTGGASYVPEMAHITCGAYSRLIRYIRSSLPLANFSPFSQPETNSHGGTHEVIDDPVPSIRPELPLQDADLVIRTPDGTNFLAHKLILNLSSADSILESLHDPPEFVDGLPVVHVDIEGQVLNEILHLLYPLNHTEYEDMSMIWAILVAARRYKLSGVLGAMRRRLLNLASSRPLPVYFLSAEFGWTDVAQAAAKYSIGPDLELEYTSEMEYGSAEAYYRLLKFNHACRSSIEKIVAQHTPDTYLGQWKTTGWASLMGPKHLLTTLLSPIVENELTIARSALKCPNPSIHGRYYDDECYDTIPPDYTISIEEIVKKSESLETEIKNELHKHMIRDTSDVPWLGEASDLMKSDVLD
ncbi:hypothetical protein PHLCEN_2v5297 [Hermanssonia centrifuga]|uniref:BTB domain-containing protein n=1 Tax=Hermanssonia centrifuga TaxID=98765 RepID=A0A2R6P8N2_9APHY|nr:hypothetical protein PHLCEN_2v5297 [Hermanssonia centrifuga]